MSRDMENNTVEAYLLNGTQIIGHFNSKSTVRDLRRYIDVASGHTAAYLLVMVSPSHKPLDNPDEPLCSSIVVQRKVEEKKRDFDSDSEDGSGSSFYRRRANTNVSSLDGSYYDQIMLAFMFTATNLAGVALLALIYYNLVMFWPYITPFFWAMVVALALRPARDKIEANNKNPLLMYFRKLKYVVLEMFHTHNIPYIVLGSLSCLMLSFLYTSMLGWKLVVAGVGIVIGLTILALILFSPPTFAAVLLLGSLTFLACTLCIFATTSIFREALDILRLLEPLFKSISEKKFEATAFMQSIGIGEEYLTVLETMHDEVFAKLNTTAEQWGLNISDIRNLHNFTELSAPANLGNNLPGFADLMNYDYSALIGLITSSWAVTTRNVVINVSSWAFGTGIYVLQLVTRFSTSFYNMVISLVVFGTSLYLMLVSNRNWVYDAVCMIPVANANSKMYNQIQQVFTGIVLTTFVACGANAVCTYFIVAWGANFKIPVMYTIVNALITLFPVAYPWVLQVPLVAHLFWAGQWVRGTGVSLLFVVLAYVDSMLYALLAPTATSTSAVLPHKWVSGLSVVMGLYTFGAQGILVGPVLVYVTIILYKVFVDAMRDPRRKDSFLRRDSLRNLIR